MGKIPTNEEVVRIAEQLSVLIKPLKSSNVFELLGINGKEIPISNYMAHLFDYKRDHECGSHFFEILIKLIEGKLPGQHQFYNQINYSSYLVQREKNNIDILISDDENKWALIIENKVFHSLNNDFIRYSHTIYAEKHLIILLSLYPHEKPANIDENIFCCITYRELVNEILESYDDLILKFSNETEVYLFKEWLKYMKNLDNRNIMNNDEIPFLKFYEENLASIKAINEASLKAENIIKEHLNEIISDLFDFSIHEKGTLEDGFYFYASGEFYKKNNQYDDQLRIYIDSRSFLNKHRITVRLELNYNKVYLYSKELADKLKSLDKEGKIEIDYNIKKYFACLVRTPISFSAISNFKQELMKEIKSRFVDSTIFETALENIQQRSKELDK